MVSVQELPLDFRKRGVAILEAIGLVPFALIGVGYFPADLARAHMQCNLTRLAARRAAHRELKARRAALDTWQERMDGLRGDPT